MDLAGGGRGDRGLLESRERLREPHPQLLGDGALHVLEGVGDDPILKSRKRLEVGDREDVRARREELADGHVAPLDGQLPAPGVGTQDEMRPPFHRDFQAVAKPRCSRRAKQVGVRSDSIADPPGGCSTAA